MSSSAIDTPEGKKAGGRIAEIQKLRQAIEEQISKLDGELKVKQQELEAKRKENALAIAQFKEAQQALQIRRSALGALTNSSLYRTMLDGGKIKETDSVDVMIGAMVEYVETADKACKIAEENAENLQMRVTKKMLRSRACRHR